MLAFLGRGFVGCRIHLSRFRRRRRRRRRRRHHCCRTHELTRARVVYIWNKGFLGRQVRPAHIETLSLYAIGHCLICTQQNRRLQDDELLSYSHVCVSTRTCALRSVKRVSMLGLRSIDLAMSDFKWTTFNNTQR